MRFAVNATFSHSELVQVAVFMRCRTLIARLDFSAMSSARGFAWSLPLHWTPFGGIRAAGEFDPGLRTVEF